MRLGVGTLTRFKFVPTVNDGMYSWATILEVLVVLVVVLSSINIVVEVNAGIKTKSWNSQISPIVTDDALEHEPIVIKVEFWQCILSKKSSKSVNTI